jgi:hypothetical protein
MSGYGRWFVAGKFFQRCARQNCIAAGECRDYKPSEERKGLNGIEVEILEGVVKVRRE